MPRSSKKFEAPNVHTFKPKYFPDLGSKGMMIESKEQLQRECARRDLVADTILNGIAPSTPHNHPTKRVFRWAGPGKVIEVTHD